MNLLNDGKSKLAIKNLAVDEKNELHFLKYYGKKVNNQEQIKMEREIISTFL
jgi:hypothetical protein